MERIEDEVGNTINGTYHPTGDGQAIYMTSHYENQHWMATFDIIGGKTVF